MGYRAFFSYARADDKIANWLHRQLDGYRTPKALVDSNGALGPVPAKLHPIFRDRSDLSGGGHLSERIEAALRLSECLVVLCTPNSAQSAWVNREVEFFLKLGRERQIFPVIAAGEPESGKPETECFPPALRGRGLLAADLREIRHPNGRLLGDGRESGRLKLIAGLLGVPLDALVRREQRRRLVRIVSSIAGSFALLSALIFGVNGFLDADRSARDARNAALIERAFESIDAGNHALAARYALAGAALDPDRSHQFEPVLASLLQRWPGRVSPIGFPEEVEHVEHASNGRLLVVARHVISVWDSNAGREIGRWNGHGPSSWVDCDIASGAVSRDGELVLSGGCDGIALLRSVGAGEVVSRFTHQDEERQEDPRSEVRVTSVAISPTGALVATGATSGSLRVWQRDGTLYRSHRFEVGGVGRILFEGESAVLAISTDGEMIRFELSSGRVVARGTVGSSDQPHVVRSSDGALIVATGERLRFWRGRRIDQPGSEIEPSECEDTALALSSSLLATGDLCGTITIRSAETLEVLNRFHGHSGWVRSLSFSEDGRRLFSGGADRSIREWRAPWGRVQGVFDPPEFEIGPTSRFDPIVAALPLGEGDDIIIARRNGFVSAWSIETDEVRRAFDQDRRGVTTSAISSDERLLAAADYDNLVRLWEVSSGRQLAMFGPMTREVVFLGFIPLRQRLLAVDNGGRVVSWSLANSVEEFSFDVSHGVSTAALNPTWQSFAIADARRPEVGIYSSEDGQLRRRLVGGSATGILALQFSRDGHRIVAGGHGGGATIWDDSGAIVATLVGHEDRIFSVTFSEDGLLVATGSADGTVRLWSARSGIMISTLAASASVEEVRFSIDGRRIFAASADGITHAWDVATGRELARIPVVSPTHFYSGVTLLDPQQRGIVWAGGTLHVVDIGPLLQDWSELRAETCDLFLAPSERVFSPSEIAQEPVLAGNWSAGREVCGDNPS